MPELPEVESIRRSLESLVAGRRIVRAEIVDPRLVQPEPPSAIAGRLAGERIAALGRRGKYLIVELESGRSLVVHLRMTGSLRRLEAGSPADPYRRAWLELDDGSRLDYRYVRRFGTWRLLEAGELEGYLARSCRSGAAGAGVHAGAPARARPARAHLRPQLRPDHPR